MEADLQHYYGIDLADYWRGDLSLRRLSVLASRLPADSNVVRAITKTQPGWDVQAYLLADLFAALTGKPHPARPTPSDGKRESRNKRLIKALQEQRERLAGNQK